MLEHSRVPANDLRPQTSDCVGLSTVSCYLPHLPSTSNLYYLYLPLVISILQMRMCRLREFLGMPSSVSDMSPTCSCQALRRQRLSSSQRLCDASGCWLVFSQSHSCLYRPFPFCHSLFPSLLSSSLSRAQGEMLTCSEATTGWLTLIRKSSSVRVCLASPSVHTPHKKCRGRN